MPDWFRWALVGAALAAAVWLASQLTDVLGMLAFALLLTAGLTPVVRRLDRWGLPHWLSVTLCFLTILALFAGMLAYLIPTAIQQAQEVAGRIGDLPGHWQTLTRRWLDWRVQYPFLPALADVGTWLQSRIGSWVQQTIGWTGAMAVLAAEVATVFVLTFFFLKDGKHLLRQLLVLLPPTRRSQVPDILETISGHVGDWVFGQAILMTVIGVATGIGLAVIGVPYAVFIGLVAGLLEAVPYVGPLLTGLLAVGVAASQSWSQALWTLGFFVILQQIENQLLVPIIFGRTVGLHPVWVILALFIGAFFFGVPGMILAVPAAATVQILIDQLYLPRIAAQEDALANGGTSPADNRPSSLADGQDKAA